MFLALARRSCAFRYSSRIFAANDMVVSDARGFNIWRHGSERSRSAVFGRGQHPAHTYEQTVAFYRDTLALPLIEEEADGCIFQFGPNRLWVDLVPNLSQPDIWLELETNDTEAAGSFLRVNGIARRDEVEQVREDFDGFFISAPNGVIHLVIGHEEA